MVNQEYRYPIQNPIVFSECFTKTHFAKTVLEGVFLQPLRNINRSNIDVQEYVRTDGKAGYSAVLKEIQMGKEKCTVIVQKDLSQTAAYTGRLAEDLCCDSANNNPVYIVTFCYFLPSVYSVGSVLKFTMCDLVGNRLYDKRWLYYVCSKYGEHISSRFLVSLCKLLRGEDCDTVEAKQINDIAMEVVSARNIDWKTCVWNELPWPEDVEAKAPKRGRYIPNMGRKVKGQNSLSLLD